MTQRVVRVTFDVPTWTQHLNTQDPLALVMRAHLYVEAALIRQIESALVNKSEFDSAKLTFPTKIKLAVALGKVDPAEVGALTVLNRLRNQFAHDLGTQLVDQDELCLYNALSQTQREFVDSLRKPEMPFIGKLRCDLIGLILPLQETRNIHA